MIASTQVSANQFAAQTTSTASLIDLPAFNELVLQYQDIVYRRACYILNDPAAAEDATQEAFLRAYRNIHRYNGSPFLPWIMRIVTNYCYDQLRRAKHRKTVPLEPLGPADEEIEAPAWLRDPAPSIEDNLIQNDEMVRVLTCLRRLPPIYREAVELADMEELSYGEAAAILNICVGTFKSRLARARAHLQEMLSLN